MQGVPIVVALVLAALVLAAVAIAVAVAAGVRARMASGRGGSMQWAAIVVLVVFVTVAVWLIVAAERRAGAWAAEDLARAQATFATVAPAGPMPGPRPTGSTGQRWAWVEPVGAPCQQEPEQASIGRGPDGVWNQRMTTCFRVAVDGGSVHVHAEARGFDPGVFSGERFQVIGGEVLRFELDPDTGEIIGSSQTDLGSGKSGTIHAFHHVDYEIGAHDVRVKVTIDVGGGRPPHQVQHAVTQEYLLRAEPEPAAGAATATAAAAVER